jgi:hypothetical protein
MWFVHDLRVFWRRIKGRAPLPELALWYDDFANGLEEFANDLPRSVQHKFERGRNEVSLTIPPQTPRHRRIDVYATPFNYEYQVGKLCGENDHPDAAAGLRLLAALDALNLGRVREVRDQRTGLLYQVYRLKTRGLDSFVQDSQYSFRNYWGTTVRKVKIARIPPLTSVAQ